MNGMNLDMDMPVYNHNKPKEPEQIFCETVEEWVNSNGWRSAQTILDKVLDGKEVEPDRTRIAMKILDIKTKLEKLSGASDSKETNPLDILGKFFNDPANRNQ